MEKRKLSGCTYVRARNGNTAVPAWAVLRRLALCTVHEADIVVDYVLLSCILELCVMARNDLV